MTTSCHLFWKEKFFDSARLVVRRRHRWVELEFTADAEVRTDDDSNDATGVGDRHTNQFPGQPLRDWADVGV